MTPRLKEVGHPPHSHPHTHIAFSTEPPLPGAIPRSYLTVTASQIQHHLGSTLSFKVLCCKPEGRQRKALCRQLRVWDIFRCASISSSDDRDSLTDRFIDWKLTVPQIPQVPQISSLKMECHSKWNVTQNGMSLKVECHSKWNVTQNGMSLKME